MSLAASFKLFSRRSYAGLLRKSPIQQPRRLCTTPVPPKVRDPSRANGQRPGTERRERSRLDTRPKIFIGAFGLAIACGTVSVIMFFEMAGRRADCEESPNEADSVLFSTEPITGSKFPLTLVGYASPDSTHWLVTKTVRCMLGLCSIERARAYSYAIYISDAGASACSSAKTTEEIAQILLPKKVCQLELEQQNTESDEPAFIASEKFQGLRKGYVFKMDTAKGGLGYHKDERSAQAVVGYQKEANYPSMVLRLLMLRDVQGDHVAHGFDRTLLNRIRDAQGGKQGSGKEALRQLNQMLIRRGTLPKGLILEFVRLPQGNVVIRIDGAEQMKLNSEAFSWAIFDAYLGRKGHLSSEARQELEQRTHEVASILEEM